MLLGSLFRLGNWMLLGSLFRLGNWLALTPLHHSRGEVFRLEQDP